MRRALISALLAIVAATLHAQPPAPPRDATPSPAAKGVIRGRVTDRDTGEPLEDLMVTLMGATGAAFRPPTVRTDRDGRYEFARLAPGRYIVSARPPRSRAIYLAQSYGSPLPDAQRLTSPRPLELAADEVRENVNISLTRSLAIEGRVIDEKGEPAVHAVVGAESFETGRMSGDGTRETDDHGAFRLFGLAPGTYRICATPPSHNYGMFEDAGGDRPVRSCYPVGDHGLRLATHLDQQR